MIYLPLLIAPPAQAPVCLVWVGTGEPIDRPAARAEVVQALAFWRDARPADLPLVVIREADAAVADAYGSWAWLRALARPGCLVVAIVANGASHRHVALGGGVAAPAYSWPGHRTLYASSWAGPAYADAPLGAQVAHEIGHARYGLPDCACATIMGDYAGAWRRWQEVAMTTDLTDVLARLDAYEAHVLAQVRRGASAGASEAEQAMQSTLAHGDVTGATRAGYRAIVVGPGQSGASELAGAVAAVEALNPGHSATSSGRLAGDVGVIFTCPTDYQADLEQQQAGKKAVLGPTLDAYRDELTARAARGG
jgi:hypothetical protein